MYISEATVAMDPYGRLAEAIVVRAAEDLRHYYKMIHETAHKRAKLVDELALAKGAEKTDIEVKIFKCDERLKRYFGSAKSCENFFHGGWFVQLSQGALDGDAIIERIKAECFKEADNNADYS